MEIIDAQLHGWDADNERFPWDPGIRNPAYMNELPITAERLIGMMDAIGVDAALLTSPSPYGNDHSYAFDAADRFPGRFGVVGPIKKPESADVEDRIREFKAKPRALAIRVSFHGTDNEHWPGSARLTVDNYRRVFATAEKEEIPVMAWVAAPRIRELAEAARSYPNMLLLIDHLGMRGRDPMTVRLKYFPDLLALAQFDNVAVKATAAPSISHEPYPFPDVWPYLHQTIEAFGLERLVWGTDMTKHMTKYTYAQALDYLRCSDQLSDSEKEAILGRSLRTLLRWPA